MLLLLQRCAKSRPLLLLLLQLLLLLRRETGRESGPLLASAQKCRPSQEALSCRLVHLGVREGQGRCGNEADEDEAGSSAALLESRAGGHGTL